MKIRVLILLFIAVCFSAQSFSQSFGHLYVWAESGLKLREAPSPSANAITTLPAGTKVTVLATPDPADHTVENISGHWLKVQVDGKTGFVFDGFLLHLPYPKDNEKDSIEKWIRANFKLTGYATSGTTWQLRQQAFGWGDESVGELSKYLYAGGIEITEQYGYEYYSKSYHFPMLSVEEIYLIARTFSEYKSLMSYAPAFPDKEKSFEGGEVIINGSGNEDNSDWIQKVMIYLESSTLELIYRDGEAIIRWSEGA